MSILDLLILTMFSLYFVGFLYCIFMLYRVDWTYKKRIEVLDKEGTKEYEKLPDFNTVLKKIWIWDIQKFKRSKNEK